MIYEVVDPLRHRQLLRACLELGRKRFGSMRMKKSLETLKMHRRRLLVVAHDQQGVAGFKLGYAERPGTFYSWLGAVAEEREGQGIGRRLMELQHQHLTENGYRLVRTGTSNHFRRMLLLNLLSGFDVVGVRIKNGRPHIQLEKRLDPTSTGGLDKRQSRGPK